MNLRILEKRTLFGYVDSEDEINKFPYFLEFNFEDGDLISGDTYYTNEDYFEEEEILFFHNTEGVWGSPEDEELDITIEEFENIYAGYEDMSIEFELQPLVKFDYLNEILKKFDETASDIDIYYYDDVKSSFYNFMSFQHLKVNML